MILTTLTCPLRMLIFLAILGATPIANAYYDPGVQRWINRDPIAESGGLNLHRALGNKALNTVDSYGLIKEFIDIWTCYSAA